VLWVDACPEVWADDASAAKSIPVMIAVDLMISLSA